MPARMRIRRPWLGLAIGSVGLVATVAAATARGTRQEPPTLTVHNTQVVAALDRWAQVEVTVPAPARVTFSVLRAGPRRHREVFRVAEEVPGRYVFEWRGTGDGGRPVRDGAYLLEVSTGAQAYTVPLAVSNTPGRRRPKVPPPPTGLAVRASQQNTLTWDRSTSTDVISYRVYRAVSKEGTYEPIGATAVGLETWTDVPTDRRVYWYRVSAVNVKGREGPPSESVSSDNVHLAQTVGPEGGTLAPTTGTVTLEIPAGAVTAPIEFTIDQIATPPTPEVNRILVTRVFDLGPSGTTFLVPAILTLRYDIPGEYPLPANYPADTTWAQSYDPATGTWTRLQGSTVDEATSTVRAEIPHLSLWQAASVTVPHGGYSSTTNLCGYCHQSHQAPGPNLHPYPTQKETCYQCHNGTGANSNVQAEFGESTIGSSTKTSYHPVPAAKDGVQLVCGSCHTPHKLMAEDAKLLRVMIGGSYVYSPPASPIGNQFCYACHGTTSTYPAPLGDHSRFESSIHNTSANVPSPASGSGVKCLACHQPHGSDFPRLTTANQEALCFSCHTQANPNTSGGPSPIAPSNPYTAFNGTANDYLQDANGVRIFHHPISDADQAGGTRQVECVSCHSPHIADQTDNGTTTTKLVDPANVRNKFIVTWQAGSYGQRGNISVFCAKCHISPNTTQPLGVTADGSVPFAINMVNDTGRNNDGGNHPHDGFSWSDWQSSGNNIHGPAGADFACTACHDFHGSSNAFMLKEKVITAASPGGAVPLGTVTTVTGWQDDQSIPGDANTIRTFCQACHGTGTHNNGQECTRCHFHGSSAALGYYTGW